MKVMYQLFKEQELLIIKVTGRYSAKHFEAFTRELAKEPDLHCIIKMLADYRETHFDREAIDKLDHIIKIRARVIREHIQTIFLVNNPLSTAAIHLMVSNLPGYKNTYCSTLDSAAALLGFPENISEIEGFLNALEKSV